MSIQEGGFIPPSDFYFSQKYQALTQRARRQCRQTPQSRDTPPLLEANARKGDERRSVSIVRKRANADGIPDRTVSLSDSIREGRTPSNVEHFNCMPVSTSDGVRAHDAGEVPAHPDEKEAGYEHGTVRELANERPF
jgi:hypothetical protein